MFLLSFFQREKMSFVFSPSYCFSLLQKKDFLFGCSCWLILKLPIFISSLFPSKKTFSTISLLECLLYLFISSFLHPLSTCSLCCLSVFSRLSHLFHPFSNLLSSCSLIVFVFYVSFTLLFFCIFVNFCKTHFFCFLDAFYIYFSMFLSFVSVSAKMVSLFLDKTIFLVWFLSLFSIFWCFWKDVVFFKRRDIFLVFSFCFFFLLFFFCSLAFWNHVCVWNNPIYFVTLGNVFFFKKKNLFSFHLLLTKKSAQKSSFFFFSNFFFTFFFIICSLFFSFINFSLWSLFSFIFLFIPFCFSHLFRAVPSWACRWFRPLVLIPFVSIEPHKFMLTLPLEWSLDTGGDVHPLPVSAEWRVGISTVTTAVIQEMRFAWAAMITLLLPVWGENTALIRCNSIAWWCARRLRRNCWSPFSYVRAPFPCSSFLWNCDGTLDSRSPYCDLSFAMIKAPWRKQWKVFSPLALCIRHRVRGVVVKITPQMTRFRDAWNWRSPNTVWRQVHNWTTKSKRK